MFFWDTVYLSKRATLSFCKVVWQRYLGEVENFLWYFVANEFKTLRINFYQNRSSTVEVMINIFFSVFLCFTVLID